MGAGTFGHPGWHDETAYLTRSREHAFLANALLAGSSVQSRPFTPQEASATAACICNLGLDSTISDDRVPAAVRLFLSVCRDLEGARRPASGIAAVATASRCKFVDIPGPAATTSSALRCRSASSVCGRTGARCPRGLLPDGNSGY
jgi:hypothetical protein